MGNVWTVLKTATLDQMVSVSATPDCYSTPLPYPACPFAIPMPLPTHSDNVFVLKAIITLAVPAWMPNA